MNGIRARAAFPGTNEADLVSRCRSRDPAARRAFAEKYYDRLFRVAWTLVGNRHGAEDLTQETFTSALRSIAAFRGDASLFTWLVAILRRTWSSRRRKEKRMKVISEIDPGGALSTDLRRTEEASDLRVVFARLSGEDRLILELFHFDELDYRQLGLALQIPIGTVKSRLFHARKKLKTYLEGTHAV